MISIRRLCKAFTVGEGQVAALVQVQLDALVVVEQPATETQPAAPAEQYAEANAFAAKFYRLDFDTGRMGLGSFVSVRGHKVRKLSIGGHA